MVQVAEATQDQHGLAGAAFFCGAVGPFLIPLEWEKHGGLTMKNWRNWWFNMVSHGKKTMQNGDFHQ